MNIANIAFSNCIVIGVVPVAAALCSVIGLFTERNPCLYDSQVFLSGQARIDQIPFGKHIKECSLVITDGCTALQNIRIVHRLRTDYGWCGGYMGIVENCQERKTLAELSLIGEPGRYRFCKVPGHTVLSHPLSLTELVVEIQSMEGLEAEQWYDILDESVVRNIFISLKKADNELQSVNPVKAAELIQNIMRDFSGLYWPVLLKDPHSDMRIVDKLMKSYPCSEEDYPALIKNMLEFFRKNVTVELDV